MGPIVLTGAVAPTMLSRMELGVAYYPEHCPEERWSVDARLMREAGIRRVRLAEFAWHRLEPREGRCDFEWLDRAIRTLEREGIGVILSTPTPAYPAWLHRKYPDIHQVKSNGQPKEFGQRQDACKNHPGYRAAARRIAERIVRRFGADPAVIAWQTDNEIGCHDTVRCYCANCERAFQSWLRERYRGDVRQLNRAWGTVFWSQEYNDFTEVSSPRDTADQAGIAGQNPGLLLDFHRFSSDTQVQFHREQAELIRRHAPGRLVTHNFMHFFYQIDYFDLARDVDVVSWDNYPYFAAGTGRPAGPLIFELPRGLKNANVWVMEQASGPGGWGAFTATPRPGEMRLWAYQAIARGADMVSFFPWRTARFGREQFWHGILHHHGEPGWRYEELRRMAAEMELLRPSLDGARPAADVGLLFDFTSLWALEAHPQVAPAAQAAVQRGGGESEASYGYISMSDQWLRVLAEMGVGGAVVPLDGDLGGYSALLAPTLHVVPRGVAERLEAYVRDGGILVLGPRSGVKEESSAVTDQVLPGVLRGLVGASVEDYDVFSARPGGPRAWSVRDSGGGVRAAYALAELLAPDEGTQVILSWADSTSLYLGRPAAVLRRLGRGFCMYVGTVLGDAGLAELFRAHLPGCRDRGMLPAGLEVVRREQPGGKGATFYLNHTDREMRVGIQGDATNLLGGARIQRELVLGPYGVAVLESS